MNNRLAAGVPFETVTPSPTGGIGEATEAGRAKLHPIPIARAAILPFWRPPSISSSSPLKTSLTGVQNLVIGCSRAFLVSALAVKVWLTEYNGFAIKTIDTKKIL